MAYCTYLPKKEDGTDYPVSVNVRSESVVICQHYTQWPPEVKERMWLDGKGGRALEMERGFLEEVLAFFDNPANREKCRLNVPPPYPDAV